jgi:hypothetical protein
MKNILFIILTVIFLCSCNGGIYIKDMPEKYYRHGYCLDKAIWILERSSNPDAIIIVGDTDHFGKTNGLHAEAVWKLSTYNSTIVSYVPLDGYNSITEVYVELSLNEAQKLKWRQHGF